MTILPAGALPNRVLLAARPDAALAGLDAIIAEFGQTLVRAA